MAWFRFYEEALDDPKVQKLPAETFKGWVNLLCLAKRHDGDLPKMEDIAFALRISLQRANSLVAELIAAGLLDEENDEIFPHNWEGRQFKTDVSTERVKRFRKRHETVSETASETPPETESDTETESEQKKSGYPIAFEAFWELVPKERKVSKRQALKAFLSATKRLDDGFSLQELGRLFAEHCREKGQYAQHPATWLNADGWLNAPAAVVPFAAPYQQERGWLDAWLKPSRIPGGIWLGQGPPPNDPGCTLPAELMEEYRDRIAVRSAELARKATAA